jgi:hypothetical protein
MATARRRWVCPKCGTRYDIPATAVDPVSCPRCQDQAAFPVVPPQVLRRPSSFGRSRSAAGVVLVACGVLVVSGLWWLATSSDEPGVLRHVAQNAVQAVAKPIGIEQDKAAIRQWLRENLDDPEFEEVKWSGPVSSDEIRVRAVAEMTDSMAAYERQLQQNPQWKGELEPFINGYRRAIESAGKADPFRAYDLRFREKNRVGAKVLSEMVFVFRAERLTALSFSDLENKSLSVSELDPRLWFLQEKAREASPDDVPKMESILHDTRWTRR